MNGVKPDAEELEMLSPRNSVAKSDDNIHLESKKSTESEYETEEDDDGFTPKMLVYAEKAEQDHKKLKAMLRPEPDSEMYVNEKGVRLEYLKDPTGWLKNYNGHTQEFVEDQHYLGYVAGLLEITINSSPYSVDRNDIYSPILLLKKIVTIKALKERQDPMRTALKLQSILKDYAGKENDRNSIYDRRIESLEEIPKNFAVMLIQACKTPIEVMKLMRIDDDTMYLDVLKAKNKRLIASKMYQKVVWQKFWGGTMADKPDSKLVGFLQALWRVVCFFFWNVFYFPMDLFSRCTNKHEERKKRRDIFFSPFSSYLADLLNYIILLALLLYVTLTTVPDPRSVHLLIHELKAGNITPFHNSNFRVEEDGRVLVKLPTPTIPASEWVLWACIFARCLTEWYQAFQKKGSSAKDKLMNYLDSVANLNDIVLILLLITGMICKLHAYISAKLYGIYNPTDHTSMVSRRLVLTIYFYSTAAVLALVHLLDICTVHIPGIGPLIRAIRKMFGVVTRVIFLFVFFILGFIVPMLSLVSCYRATHGIDGIDDEDDFYAFGSFTNTVLTLVWSMFGGLAYNHKENLYDSLDDVTTIFMAFLLVVYAILLGLMCMNLLIAIMCTAYAKVNADKSADWRYSQFESIMDYNQVTNEGPGMPFLFPFNIPYIICCTIIRSCKKRRRIRKKKTEKDKLNHVGRFICEHRKIEADSDGEPIEEEAGEDKGVDAASPVKTESKRKFINLVHQVKRQMKDGDMGGGGMGAG